MKTPLNKIILFVFNILLLTSCNFSDTVFNDYKELQPEGWNKDSLAVFDVNFEDINNTYQVIVNIRNRGNYPKQNLWLFVQYQQPDSVVVKDTIECYLADNKGKWLGSGFGSLYEMSVLFKKDLKLKQAGNYKFSIQQGMRDSMLVGINDIGLEIIKAD